MDFTFKIEKEFGEFSNDGKWAKELNLVSFNGREAKYDIRPWSPDHQNMGKGITLTEEELYALGELIARVRAGNEG